MGKGQTITICILAVVLAITVGLLFSTAMYATALQDELYSDHISVGGELFNADLDEFIYINSEGEVFYGNPSEEACHYVEGGQLYFTTFLEE